VRIAKSAVRESIIGDGQVVEGREAVNVVIDAGEEALAR
jgi:hypothetical protein